MSVTLLKYLTLLIDQPYNITFLFLIISSNSWTTFTASSFVAELLTFSCKSVFSFIFPLVIDSSSYFLISGFGFLIFCVVSLASKFASKVNIIQIWLHLLFFKNIYSSSHAVVAKKIKVVTLHSKCCLFSTLTTTLYND